MKKSHFIVFSILIIFINIMGIADIFFTLFWYSHDLMEELNPIMNFLLEKDSYLFAYIKLALTTFGSFILIKYHKYILSFVGAGICFGSLFIITYLHIINGLLNYL